MRIKVMLLKAKRERTKRTKSEKLTDIIEAILNN